MTSSSDFLSRANPFLYIFLYVRSDDGATFVVKDTEAFASKIIPEVNK